MSWVRNAVERASPRTEFIVVCLFAFGWFSLSSIVWVMRMMTRAVERVAAAGPTIDQRHVFVLVVYESIVLVGLGWCLAIRGWSRAKIGLHSTWAATGIGIALAAGAYLAALIGASTLAAVSPRLGQLIFHARFVSSGISPLAIAAICIVNPLFEELFVCGYVISFLKPRHGFWFAVNASAAIRLLYHLYQGPVAVVSILPVGLGFGYWYARTNQLWPLIAAHALMDAMALIANQ